MPRSGYQLRVRDPQILLLLPLLARAHRHAPILRTNPVDTPELSAYESRLTPRAAKRQIIHPLLSPTKNGELRARLGLEDAHSVGRPARRKRYLNRGSERTSAE